jgi:hypothetical protein
MDNQVPVEKLVKIYIKMREKHAEMLHEFKDKEAALKTQMEKVKAALLDFCKENDIDSVRTAEGLFFRTVKQNYWTNDWEAMGKFVVEHQAPELLEKRLNQGNMKQFLEEHPDLLPPGLNVDSQYSVTVRRK